ncbi:MAG: Formamidopyrimidine-DNA glycosylase [uncultured Thermomicrobiales bacterium]|uniref:Formamidopyrimidine-DNA glycosylase n=1 Tax=uncultured Thermomicrobiales bacterium TaxID=1645740 RepID=A0A6J4UCP0_9BACT|nr:MAG: Formamidopyrimidine-DNA glycosylase [uncultured Thermomicrobiales bacterium]
MPNQAIPSMPELPEVETVRRSLLERVVGRVIVGVRPAAFPGVMGSEGIAAGAARLRDRRVDAIERRGKYLLFSLDDGTFLMVHLRMTGRLVLAARNDPSLRFEHLAIELDDGSDLRFADQRKFGRVLPLLPEQVVVLDRRLGPEPLAASFTAETLASGLARRRGKLKAVLLDQALIAGLGNIYVDEALFRARLHPERRPDSLSRDEIRRLHRAVRAVLREAIANQGTTFSTFENAHGEAGANQENLRAYGRGRSAQPCLRCGRPFGLLTVGGRSTHYCARCQPLAVA